VIEHPDRIEAEPLGTLGEVGGLGEGGHPAVDDLAECHGNRHADAHRRSLRGPA
jgi:hypothetical protein